MSVKVVITVTVDCSASYPNFAAMPPIEDTAAVAQEYVRAIDAGASLVHHHGVHHLETEIQADGRRLSKTNFEGWADLTDMIRRNPIPALLIGIGVGFLISRATRS